ILLLALRRIVVKVAAQQDGAGLRQIHQQRLMPRRVSRRGYDHHRTVAEDIMVAVEQGGLAVLQGRESGGSGFGRRAVWRTRPQRSRKHHVALRLLHEPHGAGKGVGIGRVVVVIVRQREVGHIGGLYPISASWLCKVCCTVARKLVVPPGWIISSGMTPVSQSSVPRGCAMRYAATDMSVVVTPCSMSGAGLPLLSLPQSNTYSFRDEADP